MTVSRALAFAGWIVSIALIAAAVVLIIASRHAPAPVALLFRGSESTLALAMSTVGVVISTRKPRHRIGWLFSAAGLSVSLIVFCEHYAVYSFLARTRPLPGAVAAAWLQSWIGVAAYFSLLALLLLLFPDGHLPSERWRPVPVLVILSALLVTIGLAFRPGPVDVLSFVSNPLGLHGSAGRIVARAGSVGENLMFGTIVLAAVAFIVRFARSRGAARQQLKWLLTAVSLVVAVFAAIIAYGNPDRLPTFVNVLFLVTLLQIPIATAIAILRHQLFDIDRLISRTLSYAIVTVVLGGGFALVALGAPTFFLSSRTTPNWVIAAATLAVAASARPALRRVQARVDHRFNRSHYDAERTIGAFTARLRDEIDLDALGLELESIVGATMQPSHVRLWLRGNT